MKYLVILVLVALVLLPSCSMVTAGGGYLCDRIDDLNSGGTFIGAKIGQVIDLAFSVGCGVIRSGTGDWEGAWEDLKTKGKAIFSSLDEAPEVPAGEPTGALLAGPRPQLLAA